MVHPRGSAAWSNRPSGRVGFGGDYSTKKGKCKNLKRAFQSLRCHPLKRPFATLQATGLRTGLVSDRSVEMSGSGLPARLAPRPAVRSLRPLVHSGRQSRRRTLLRAAGGPPARRLRPSARPLARGDPRLLPSAAGRARGISTPSAPVVGWPRRRACRASFCCSAVIRPSYW